MLDKETTETVLWFLRTFRFTAAFPIEDDGCGGFRPARSKKYMIWHYVLSTYHCMAMLYSGIRLAQSVNLGNSIGDKCLHSFFFGCYMLAVTFKLNLQINRNNMAAFLNFCFNSKERTVENLGMDASIAGHLRGRSAEGKLRMILKGSVWFALVQSGFIALSLTQAKCSPRYLLSLMDNCHEINMSYVLLLLPYEYLVWIQGWAMFVFYITVIVIWVVESGYWLSIAEWQQFKVTQGRRKLDEFKRFMRVYHRLQILNTNFNSMLQDYFWPAEQAIFISLMTILYFIMIKMHSVLPAFIYGFLTVPTMMLHGYVFFCYREIAIGEGRSKELLIRWMTCEGWNTIKRDVRACREVGVKVGRYYSFNRCSNLVFTSLMVQILCNLLIAVG